MYETGGGGEPLEQIARVEEQSRRVETPCGDGQMVWRLWGAGPPLLLLHGNFGSWTHWIRNVETLARFYTVIVPDTPGFGESDLPPSFDSPGAIADVVADGLRDVLPPDDPVIVVGFSYGGRLAGELGVRLPDRVARIVCVAPAGLGIDDSMRPGLAKLRSGMTPDAVAAVHRQNLAMLMIADADAVDDLAVHIHDSNTRRSRFRLSAWSEEDRRTSLAQVLPGVRAPVMGIWSDRDSFAADTLQNRMDVVWQLQPNADLRMLNGAGHWMQYEAADRFNDLLLDMLWGAR
jgi:pimeloyl-ACP methyl ester carboxylesterase